MFKKYSKIGIILLIILFAGCFWGYQKFWSNSPEKNKTEEKLLGNSQKVTDKFNQLLVKISASGEADDGDIITIGGETHEWGKMEKIKFLIVTIPVLSETEKADFLKVENGKKIYRVAYEKFLTPEEIEKIKTEKGLEKYTLISKDDIIKR
jgi:hypothetical protein